MNMSRTCFLSLSDLCETMKHHGEASMYREIAKEVEKLTHVLYCTRLTNNTHKSLFELSGKEIFH